MNVHPAEPPPGRGVTAPLALLALGAALACSPGYQRMPYMNSQNEFWAEGYWKFEPRESFELTESKLRELARSLGTDPPESALKDAYWLLTQAEGQMFLSPYQRAELRYTSRTGDHGAPETQNIAGVWRPRPDGFEFEVESPANIAGEHLAFVREHNTRVHIDRGDVCHVWTFVRSNR